MEILKKNQKKFRLQHQVQRYILRENLVIDMFETQRPQKSIGNTVRCEFWGNDNFHCKSMFKNRADQKEHIQKCIFGIMQFCKETGCESNRVFRNPQAFTEHSLLKHGLTTIDGNSANDIFIDLNDGLLQGITEGYNIRLLRRFQFSVEDEKVSVTLGVLAQPLGSRDHRLGVVSMVHNEQSKRFLIEMKCTLRNVFNNAVITPLTCPRYDENDSNATITMHAFTSQTDLCKAVQNLDGLISYACSDIPAGESVLEISFKQHRLLVSEEGAFPMVPIALSWEDLQLEESVRATLTDGRLDRPSQMTKTVICQMRGQANVMIETTDTNSFKNALMGGVFDMIVKSTFQRKHSGGPVQAIIIYPTVTIMRMYEEQWKKRANVLNVQVVTVDSNDNCMKKHIQRYRPDVILITPELLCKLLCNDSPIFLRQITDDLKVIYFHQQQRNCCPSVRYSLEYCMSIIPPNRAVIVGYSELMTDAIKTASQTTSKFDDGEKSDEYDFPPVFNQGWNFFSIGSRPERVIREMKEQIIQIGNPNEKIPHIIRIIKQQGNNRRWLIFASNNDDVSQINASILRKVKDENRLTAVSNINDVINNSNFWDPFMVRTNSIVIGPYFLLDCVQAQLCDGVILFNPPEHDADRVRIRNIVAVPNDDQLKPVISFKLR